MCLKATRDIEIFEELSYDDGTGFRKEMRKAYVPPPGKRADERARSKFTSEMWKRMSKEEKAPWREKARLADEEHKSKYPNYKLTLKRKPAIEEALALKREKKEAKSPKKVRSIGFK